MRHFYAVNANFSFFQVLRLNLVQIRTQNMTTNKFIKPRINVQY